jgi:archaellum biogenesis ATPase FlaH
MGSHLAKEMNMKDTHGGNLNEFPRHLQIREYPLPLAEPAEKNEMISNQKNNYSSMETEKETIEISTPTAAKKQPSYVITGEQLLAMKITQVPMLFPPLLQKVGVASLCGSSDTGKSYLCLNLALSICGKEEKVLGLDINKTHGSVIVVCTEDAAEDLCVRLTSLADGKDINSKNLRFIFETENLVKKLDDELNRQPTDLIIVDTLGDVLGGNLNQSIEVRQFLKPYKDLAKEHKCLILFNHHIGKGKENNTAPSKNDVLGSQAIESACRTVLMLRKNPDGKRVLTIVKGNNVPDHIKNKGMVLHFDPIAGFTCTGENIVYSAEATNKDEKGAELNVKVAELYPILGSYEKVATELRKQGHKIDKNKVGQILKTVRPSVPDIGKNDDGQDSIAA